VDERGAWRPERLPVAAQAPAPPSTLSRTLDSLAHLTVQDQLTMMKEQRGAAEAQCDSLSEQNRALKARIAELEVLGGALEEKLRDSEASRRKLHNAVLALKGNIRVFCRVRPLSQSEKEGHEDVALAPVASGDLSGRGLELDNGLI